MRSRWLFVGLAAIVGMGTTVVDYLSSPWTGSGPTTSTVMSLSGFAAILGLTLPAVRRRLVNAHDYALALAAVAVPVAGVGLYRRVLVDPDFCLPCSIELGCYCLILIATLPGEPSGAPLLSRLRSDLRRLSAGFGVGILLAFGGTVGAATALASSYHLPVWLQRQEKADFAATHIGGDPATGVRVVVFRDFQCPFCRARDAAYAPVVARLNERYSGAISVRPVDLPLEPECNDFVSRPIHPAACEGAVLVRLAAERRVEDEATDVLYRRQADLTGADVEAIAHDFGLAEEYRSRYDEVGSLVRQDAALAHELGLTGTPTYFVNGIRIPALSPESFEAVVEHVLESQRRRLR